MTFSEWKARLEADLKHCYLIEINDTHLSDDALATRVYQDGTLPFEAANEIAEDADLVRGDIAGDYGVARYVPMTQEDEAAAIAAIGRSDAKLRP